MAEAIIDVVINTTDYFILLFIMQYICAAHMDLNRKNLLIGFGMSFTTSILINIFPFFQMFIFPALLTMTLLIALSVLLFSRRKFLDLFLFFPAVAIYFIVTLLPGGVVNALFPDSHGAVIHSEFLDLIISLLSNFFLLFLLIFLRRVLTKYQSNIHFTVKEVFGCIGLLFFSLIDVLLLMSFDKASLGAPLYYTWVAIFLGALIFGIGYYIYSMVDSRMRAFRKTMSQNEVEYLQLQLDALQDTKENEEQIKRMRHDLKNHLAIIQTLCDQGNYDEVRKYTAELNADVLLPINSVRSGNRTVDMILYSKMKQATERDIKFTYSGSFESLKKMSAPDICGLLSNAYDNAIECCTLQKDAYIRTEVNTTPNYTVIQITNSIAKKVRIQNNSIATTKDDKTTHGYGTVIMKRIAHKYGGSCTFSSTKDEFKVKIVLLT